MGQSLTQLVLGGGVRALQLRQHRDQARQVRAVGVQIALRCRLVGVDLAGRESPIQLRAEQLAFELRDLHVAAIQVGVKGGSESETALGHTRQLLAGRQGKGIEELGEVRTVDHQLASRARLVILDVVRAELTTHARAETVKLKPAQFGCFDFQIHIKPGVQLQLRRAARQLRATQISHQHQRRHHVMLVIDVVVQRAGEIDVGIERRLIGLSDGGDSQSDGLAEDQRAAGSGELGQTHLLPAQRIVPGEATVGDVDATEDQRRHPTTTTVLRLSTLAAGVAADEIVPVAHACGITREIDAHAVRHDGLHLDASTQQRAGRDRDLDLLSGQ